MQMFCKRGYTLIEILIVLAVLGALAIITIFAFSPFKQNTELDTTTERITSLILEARSKSLSSENASSYGIHFEATRVVLFIGTVYSASDPANEEFILPTAIIISSISLAGGGNDIVFSRLTGEVSEYGFVTLERTADPAQSKQISITSTGLSSVL